MIDYPVVQRCVHVLQAAQRLGLSPTGAVDAGIAAGTEMETEKERLS